VIKGGAKMSKSLGNVVSPDDMVARYGADATRMYTLFGGPPDKDLDWQDEGIEGIQRFLGRVYRFVAQNAHPEHADWNKPVPDDLNPLVKMLRRRLHQTIRRVGSDFEGRWHFNTSIAAMMELMNTANQVLQVPDQQRRQAERDAAAGTRYHDFGGRIVVPIPLLAEVQRNLVLMLAPFAPYLAHELWEMLGETSELLRAPWPKYDPALAKEEEVEIGIQVNGKIRSRVVVPADAADDHVRELALADEKVKAAIEGKEIVKVLVVRGRLVNIAVKEK
jgi:leucyl-tRNA synthetase